MPRPAHRAISHEDSVSLDAQETGGCPSKVPPANQKSTCDIDCHSRWRKAFLKRDISRLRNARMVLAGLVYRVRYRMHINRGKTRV